MRGVLKCAMTRLIGRSGSGMSGLAVGTTDSDVGLLPLGTFVIPGKGRFPMRILALTILAIVTVSATPSARAQTYDPSYPVCLQVYQGYTDYYFECAYTSLPQCQASASGRPAQCVVNPYYAGAKRRERRQRRVY
jgi:hypothetical protein